MPKSVKGKHVRLAHLGIEVSSLSRSRKFYETLAKAIGLKQVFDSPETLGWSNDELDIWIAVSNESRVTRRPPKGNEEVIAEHAAIYLEDKESVDAADSVMRKGGFPPFFAPEEHPEFSTGYYSATYCDPENYVIEFFTYPK
jgi:catechol 2,3-dioxygenase-like lactoylglutathione lyase family enzyme